MVNVEKLENSIKKEIEKLRNLGEHSRSGSDHLYYRSLIKFKLGRVKHLKDQENPTFAAICEYDIYTETEFLHSPEMDELYTEHYKDKFILDKDFTISDVIDIRKKQ